MGLIPPEEKKRNQQLYKDWQKKISIVDLVTKYQISTARIYQIIEKQKEKMSL